MQQSAIARVVIDRLCRSHATNTSFSPPLFCFWFVLSLFWCCFIVVWWRRSFDIGVQEEEEEEEEDPLRIRARQSETSVRGYRNSVSPTLVSDHVVVTFEVLEHRGVTPLRS
jgi:hypothetical protein